MNSQNESKKTNVNTEIIPKPVSYEENRYLMYSKIARVVAYNE